jgi:lipoprotein-anchoring transpeptidase ErfK/SrfK
VLLALVFGAAAPAAGPPLPLVERGVRVLTVNVGGMTSEGARARIHAAFQRPVTFKLGDETWRARPSRLGADADVDHAVAVALRARPGATVPMHVSIWNARLETYVATLAGKYSYPAKNAELTGLQGMTPVITPSSTGRKVDTEAMASDIIRVVRTNTRPVVPLQLKTIRPAVTSDDFGSIIVISRGGNQLNLYDGASLERTFRVATGQAQYPTPTGQWSIVTMQRDPWWYPPTTSEWAKGLKPVPPGPGNPLGTRWMGLSAAGVGIHGTPDPASIGYSASHGCIRMYVPDAEWLFEHVSVGTPVFVI